MPEREVKLTPDMEPEERVHIVAAMANALGRQGYDLNSTRMTRRDGEEDWTVTLVFGEGPKPRKT